MKKSPTLCCCHISTVGLIIHLTLTYNDLAYQIFYIYTWFFTFPYNNDLIVGRHSTAKTVDLLWIRDGPLLQKAG